MVPEQPGRLRASRCRPPVGVPLQATFPHGPEAPGAARAFARDLLEQEAPDLSPDALGEVLVIVSELVTNAYRYATKPGEVVLVAILVSAELVRVEVHDPVQRRPRFQVATANGGRGLRIVDAFAKRWDVDVRPDGKSVWAEVAR
ncbi:ATP-binding protein [Streptomyces sp. NPDC021225]|uniref:ATP-binding protein n=1 Tax=Streptomyces sp. NPDC021225 TaxID=3365121 RepID=UPI0037A59124